MARKLRLEFLGACYHVINRGNYRADIFQTEGAKVAFETCLFEACGKSRWLLHAFVVLRNHYHLALETPDGNLVTGMQWLQATFANRFNRFHGERGHVFQSRYKSILIEEGRPLLGLVNYIHLNPVRAGIHGVEDLKDYPFSSYPKFFQENPPLCLSRARFLGALDFPDTVKGMRKYAEYLETVEESDPSKHDELSQRYCSGWALASLDYRKEIKALYAGIPEKKGWQGDEVRELREGKWEMELKKLLRRARKTHDEVLAAPKSAAWKIKIACELKRETTATNPWIANALSMGHPSRIPNLIATFKI
jgi:REP element-mobilizing transposase RayT